MCTMIAHKAPISGSGKGAAGWFSVGHVYVGYDHPYHVALDHALMLDFVDEEAGPHARVAVELDLASARELAEHILVAVAEAEVYERGTRATSPPPPAPA